MALKITDECIACGACVPECPTNSITEGSPYVIDRRHLRGVCRPFRHPAVPVQSARWPIRPSSRHNGISLKPGAERSAPGHLTGWQIFYGDGLHPTIHPGNCSIIPLIEYSTFGAG